MNLHEYTAEALKTAQPEAFELEYLIPGIVGEVGEIFGQRAKGFWHGWDLNRKAKEFTAEIGDVCWMTAILLSKYREDNAAEPEAIDAMLFQAIEPTIDPWMRMLRVAQNLYHWYSGDDLTRIYIPGEAALMWGTLRTVAPIITGVSFDQVLQANLDKLKSRAERNVLRGAGDHR